MMTDRAKRIIEAIKNRQSRTVIGADSGMTTDGKKETSNLPGITSILVVIGGGYLVSRMLKR